MPMFTTHTAIASINKNDHKIPNTNPTFFGKSQKSHSATAKPPNQNPVIATDRKSTILKNLIFESRI